MLPLLHAKREHPPNLNYPSISPTSCSTQCTALLLTHPYSTDICRGTFCFWLCNTLRLCETSHLTLFISNLLSGTCKRPRISLSPFLLQTPSFLPIICDNTPPGIFSMGQREKKLEERRGKRESDLLWINAIEQEGECCSGCARGRWLIHPPSNPRVPMEELSSEARQLSVIFRKSFPPLFSFSCSRKSFLGHYIKKKKTSTKQPKLHLISWRFPLNLTSFFPFSLSVFF